MPIIDLFIKLIEKYHPDTIFYKDPSSHLMFILAEDVKDIIGSYTWLPCSSMTQNCSFTKIVLQGSTFCYLDDLLTFVQDSIEEKSLGQLHNETNGHDKRILWRNAHFVVDYHKPLGIYDKSKYSDQVNIIVDLIENVMSKYDLYGECEYEMSRCTNTKFRVDYFINLPIPIIIEIDEKKHGEYREKLNDREKDKLNLLGFNVIRIKAEFWSKNKEYYRNELDTAIQKYTGLLFVKGIQKKINELKLKESFEYFGIQNYSKLVQNDFIFPLNKVLAKFDIDTGEPMYNIIMERFMILDNNETSSCNMKNSSLECDISSEYDSDLDSDMESDLDSEPDNSLDNTDIKNSDQDVKVLGTKGTISKWIPGVHYIYNKEKEEYYLKYPTIVAIATISGKSMGQDYIDRTWELICYINNNIDTARKNIVELMTIDNYARKKMFNTIKNIAIANIKDKLKNQEEKTKFLNFKLQEISNEKNKKMLV